MVFTVLAVSLLALIALVTIQRINPHNAVPTPPRMVFKLTVNWRFVAMKGRCFLAVISDDNLVHHFQFRLLLFPDDESEESIAIGEGQILWQISREMNV